MAGLQEDDFASRRPGEAPFPKPADATAVTSERSEIRWLRRSLLEARRKHDRLLLAVDAAGDWRAALALANAWTPPELPVSGGDALKLGLKPGPKVGGLLDQVERWWIAGDFTADRDACLAELERLAKHT